MPADRPAQERGEGIRRWTLRYCDFCGRGGVVNPDDDYLSTIMHRRGCEAKTLAIREVEVADEQAVRRDAWTVAVESVRTCAAANAGPIADFLARMAREANDDLRAGRTISWADLRTELDAADSLASEPAEGSEG